MSPSKPTLPQPGLADYEVRSVSRPTGAKPLRILCSCVKQHPFCREICFIQDIYPGNSSLSQDWENSLRFSASRLPLAFSKRCLPTRVLLSRELALRGGGRLAPTASFWLRQISAPRSRLRQLLLWLLDAGVQAARTKPSARGRITPDNPSCFPWNCAEREKWCNWDYRLFAVTSRNLNPLERLSRNPGKQALRSSKRQLEEKLVTY